MRKIKDVLRLKLDAKLSHQQIAAALGISKGVVTKYVGLAAAAGLDWADRARHGRGRAGTAAAGGARTAARPCAARLRSPASGAAPQGHDADAAVGGAPRRPRRPARPTPTPSSARTTGASPSSSSARCARSTAPARSCSSITPARPSALTDGSRAHIFVAALGASSYTYACATPRETMADWLESTARALSFYGGVPQLIVPDNPKAMICGCQPLRAAQQRHRARLRTPLRHLDPAGAAVSSAGQGQGRIGGADRRALDHGAPAPSAVRQRARGQCGHRAAADEAQRQAVPEAARQPRQHLRRDRCAGLAAAAATALRDGPLQDRQGPHRLPRRGRAPSLQRAARPGRSGAGSAHHHGGGRAAASRPARRQPCPQ